jgi:hypothetical protein
MGIKISGDKIVVASLRYQADKVPEAGRKTMHRIANAVVKDAQLFAPVDKHNLEKSITKQVSYGERGRLQIEIAAGGYVNGVDVSEYVAKVHENYSMMKPGPGTIVKRAANPGVYIGEKFLDRAIKKHADRAVEIVRQAVNQVLKYAD